MNNFERAVVKAAQAWAPTKDTRTDSGLRDQLRTAVTNLNVEKPTRYRVWHIPQVPGKPYEFLTDDIRIARAVQNVLAEYDEFQFQNRIKPDYANVSGIQRWRDDWQEWEEIDDDDDEDAEDA